MPSSTDARESSRARCADGASSGGLWPDDRQHHRSQYAGHPRSALRRADGGSGPEPDQHAPRSRHGRVHHAQEDVGAYPCLEASSTAKPKFCSRIVSMSPTVAKALASVEKKPIVIDIDDPLGSGGDLLGDEPRARILSLPLRLPRRDGLSKLFSRRGARSSSASSGRRTSGTRSFAQLKHASGTTGNPKGRSSITIVALRF